MQVGDKVHCVGTVKDMVGGSVLVQTDALPNNPGHEYWFLESTILPFTESPAQAVAAAEEAATKTPAHTGPAPHTATAVKK